MSRRIHHTVYAADAKLVADARAERLTPARLRDLQPVFEFDTDETEDCPPLMMKQSIAALGPDVEHFVLRSTTCDRDIWTFGSFGDPLATSYQPALDVWN